MVTINIWHFDLRPRENRGGGGGDGTPGSADKFSAGD